MVKEAEAGAKTKELCRKHGISEATFYAVVRQVATAGMTCSHSHHGVVDCPTCNATSAPRFESRAP